MIDALQEIRQKLFEHGFILKICSCCKHFRSEQDGSTNMLKGICLSDYPSPSLKEKRATLIWNSCAEFESAKVINPIEELAAQQ